MLAAVHAFAGGFDTDQARVCMIDVGVEDAHRIAAAANTGHDRIGLRAVTACGLQHLGHLHPTLLADDALEVAHHHRVGVWASYRADDVEGVFNVGDPVAHGFVERVFERAATAFHRHHRGTEQLHTVDIGALALDVLAAHIDHAFEPVARADGGGGHTVLAGTGLGDDARLAHAFGQHGLTDGVVDLVCAGVVQVFALEKYLRATLFPAHARGVVDRRRSTDEVRQFVVEFGNKGRVVLVTRVGVLEFVDGVGQRFGDKAAAVDAEVTTGVGLLVTVHDYSVGGCPARASNSVSAARTAATNCLIFSGSLMPLLPAPDSSTPELTSTARLLARGRT